MEPNGGRDTQGRLAETSASRTNAKGAWNLRTVMSARRSLRLLTVETTAAPLRPAIQEIGDDPLIGKPPTDVQLETSVRNQPVVP